MAAILSPNTEPSSMTPNRGSTYSADHHGISSANEHLPQSDIFVAARGSDIKVIREPIESGRARAKDRDE